MLLPLLFLAGLSLAAGCDYLPLPLVAAYWLLSTLTFLIYAADKRAARRHGARHSEASLHWLALLGGWPGAWLAQQALRHKSSKRSFRWRFWLTVLTNGGLLSTYLWFRHGQ